MRQFTRFIGIFMLLALPIVPSLAHQTVFSEAVTCPEIVTNALKTADQLCGNAGRNQACYGHIMLEASPQPDVAEFTFTQEGDIVDVVDVQTLRLSAMDITTGSWGIALMRVQADLQDVSSTEPIVMLMFGDIEIENAVKLPSSTVDLAVVADTINVRNAPSTVSKIVGTLASGQTIIATGRLEDGTWLRVTLPDSGGAGWVYARLLEYNDAILTLDVIEGASSAIYGPMQAFYFRSGAGDTTCPQANNGLLIQTPEGVAQVSLLINEIDIQLGSTVFFQAQPGETMTISVVEGSARVEAFGTVQKAYAGSEISVPITDDLQPAGPPEPPKPYDMAEMELLPVDYLARRITVHEPLTEEELAEAQNTFEAEVSLEETDPNMSSGDEPSDPTVSEDPATVNDTGTPPGLIDNPGLGDNLPPGQGGSPPGQEDKDKDK